jgi:hypothetical protein
VCSSDTTYCSRRRPPPPCAAARDTERTAALPRGRLAEAAGTGTLITFCHYCSEVFRSCAADRGYLLPVANVLELVARSMRTALSGARD